VRREGGREGGRNEVEDEEKEYPHRLDQASMTVQLSVGMEYPGGSREMAAETTVSSSFLPSSPPRPLPLPPSRRTPLPGQIR
jgi:hypothetical protein